MVTKVTWVNNSSGDWATASNWSTGMVPDSADAVTIATATVQTITHNSGNDVVSSLTVGNDHFDLNGGSLEILKTASFADGFVQNGGTLAAGNVTIHKGGVLDGGSATGSTVLNIAGPIAIANYTLAGSAVLKNTNVTSQTGQITVGDAPGVDATISNAAAGKYDIAGDYGITGGAASASFLNAGLLAKTNGSGTSNVGIDVTSTGTISVAAGGTLEFSGPNDVIGGTLSGAGTLEFGGASNTTLTVASVGTGGFTITDGASVTLGTNTVFGGAYTQAGNFGQAVLALGANNLTLSGTSSISGFEGSSLITGSGTLNNAGALSLSALTLGGTVALHNTSTVTQVGGVTLGDSSGAATQIANAAGAVYDFTQDVSLGLGADSGAAFSNAGTLEKTQSTGASNVAAVVSNLAGATIASSTGFLSFSNVLTNAGTITGSGHVQFISPASIALNAGTVLTVGELDLIGGASVTLGTSLSYGGVFDDAASFGITTLDLGNNDFTLSGTNDAISGFEGSATIDGAGTLTSTGTLGAGQLTLGGTITFDNTGVVNQAGTITVGDGSGGTVLIDNAAGATWNLVNTSGLSDGASSLSAFENFGTLNASPGGGNVVTVNTTLTNEKGGAISIGNGALALDGTLINDAAISGNDLQLTGSGVTTLNAGTALPVSEIDLLDGATIKLGVNITYAGSFQDAANFGQTFVDLNAHNLILSGPASFSGFEGAAFVSGAGTLTAKGTTQLGGLTLAAGATFSNTGSLNATGNLTIGSGSAAAMFSNGSGGIYDLTNDSGIGIGSSMASSFINNGLFEKTSGTGTSVVSSSFTNDGTITVTNGTVEFVVGTLHNSGTINGVESTDQFGNIFITHS